MARQPRRVPSKSRPAVAAGAADTIPSRPAVQHVVTDPRRVAARSTARGTRGPEALTPRGAARVERERAAGAGPTWVRASRWRLVGDAPCINWQVLGTRLAAHLTVSEGVVLDGDVVLARLALRPKKPWVLTLERRYVGGTEVPLHVSSSLGLEVEARRVGARQGIVVAGRGTGAGPLRFAVRVAGGEVAEVLREHPFSARPPRSLPTRYEVTLHRLDAEQRVLLLAMLLRLEAFGRAVAARGRR